MKAMTKSLLLLSTVVLLTVASPVENEPRKIESRQETVNYRLSADVTPLKYELDITPHFVDEAVDKKAFTFTGKVKISFITNVDVNEIVLHQNDLIISTYSILHPNGTTESGSYNPTQYNNVTDKWTIPLVGNLSSFSSIYTLEVDYTGHMRDDMHGFYRTYYKENNVTKWMASTQFEQTEARRAFPCFDEPGFKATFKLSLLVPLTMKAISNTPGTRVSEAGKFRYNFLETPEMSTYLLAFIVSSYDRNQNNTFGVYARPEAKNQTDFSLKAGVELLEKFDQYLKIKYDSLGIAKLDMAAIPDFSAGAMENWGLLTYRESNILQYSNDTPTLSEQRIVAVIAHEQAHQWFGDSVTCKWWSETWLNEAFGRYFQFFGTAWLYPDWDLEEQFVVENHQQSMQLDSTDDTHPMTDPSVSTKAQAAAMFDNISYNKAASIMRMLRNTIGDVPFQNTLTRYLNDNKGQAVEPIKLFTAIDTITTVAPGATQYKLSEIFLPWTKQSGFPLVTVKRENKTLTLTQKRFMRSGVTTKTEKWTIPITFAIDSNDYTDTTPKFYMNESASGESTFELPMTPERYYLLNNKQTGYYRVNYDEENWSKIKEALFTENFDKIEHYNRAQIVDDLFQLARAGIVKYSKAIDIIRYIKKEKHYAPWLSAISHGLTFLSQRVSGEKDQKTFAWFVKDLMDDIYKHLKFYPAATDRRTDIYNRANILSWLCKYGHEECINLSKEHFNALVVNDTEVWKDHRAVVYCNGVREGNATHFNFLYDLHAKTDISIEQLTLLSGMSCTKDPELVEKYLNLITETELIRPQDRTSAINNMLNSNPDGPQWLYNYITNNHTRWSSKLGNLNTLTTVAGRFTNQTQFDEYSTFLTSKVTELGDSHTSLTNGLTAARANLEWDTKYMKEFMEHLNTLNDDDKSSPANAKAVSIFVTLISLVALYVSY